MTLTVKPLTDRQLDQAIQHSQEVIDLIRTRRKPEPLAPS
jgi:hypothetical protein